jgi:hypothetical protein
MAITVTSRIDQSHTVKPTLDLAFELGLEQWKLGVTTGVTQRPQERSMTAGDVQGVLTEVARAKRRFGLPEDARVVSCYQAAGMGSGSTVSSWRTGSGTLSWTRRASR